MILRLPHSFRRFWNARTGPDIFISYSRLDAAAYAFQLATALSGKDLSCYLDQWGSPPGADLPSAVLRALRRSKLLVVCVSAGAVGSAAVQQEVATFLAGGGPIVPLVFGAAWDAAAWTRHLTGIARTNEPAEALRDGTPSVGAVNRVVSAFQFRRRNSVVRRDFIALGIGILCAAIGAIFLGWEARQQQNIALERGVQAQAQIAAATSTSLIGVDPELAVLVALEAVRAAPRADNVESTLREALLQSRLRVVLPLGKKGANDVAFSPNGELIGGVADDGLSVWRAASYQRLFTLAIGGNSITFSPTGKLLAVASTRTVYLVDVDKGSVVLKLEAVSNEIKRLSFSVDDHFLAFSDSDAARIVDLKTLTELPQVKTRSWVEWVSFFPDSKNLLITVYGEGAVVWSVTKWAATWTITAGDPQLNFTSDISSDGHTFAIPNLSEPSLWNAQTKKRVGILANTALVTCSKFSPDGTMIVTASADGAARVWRAADASLLSQLVGHLSGIRSCAFDPTSKLVLTASNDGTLRVFVAATGESILTLRGNRAPVIAASFQPDGELVASASDDGVRLWDVRAGVQPLQQLSPSRSLLSSYEAKVAFVPENSELLFGDRDTRPVWWDIHSGKKVDRTFLSDSSRLIAINTSGTSYAILTNRLLTIRRLKDDRPIFSLSDIDQPRALDFDEQNGLVFLQRIDNWSVEVWDMADRRKLAKVPYSYLDDVLISVPGKRMAVVSPEGTVSIFDFKGVKTTEINVPTIDDRVHAWLSPDAKVLAYMNAQARLCLHRIEDGRELVLAAQMPNDVRVEFSIDGRLFASFHDEDGQIWDTASGRQMVGFYGHRQWIAQVVFTGDDRFAASMESGGITKIWDTKTGHGLQTFLVDAAYPTGRFSADNLYFAIAGTGNVASVFQCEECRVGAGLVELAMRRVTRTLSDFERSIYTAKLPHS